MAAAEPAYSPDLVPEVDMTDLTALEDGSLVLVDVADTCKPR